MKIKPYTSRITLFTNLSYVIVNGLRTNCHALIIENIPQHGKYDSVGGKSMIRGFGMDSSWPVFDLRPESIEYETIDARGNIFMLSDAGVRPILTGLKLKLKSGEELVLWADDSKRPIDVQVFEKVGSEYPRELYPEVWEVLNRKTYEYVTTPGMPVLTWTMNSRCRY